MAEKVLMLALSPTMEEGTIVKWLKNEGDAVKNGDILCEVETDKATMDYESIQEGTLLKIVVPAGSSAKVEQPIAIIGKSGEDIAAMIASLERPGSKGAVGTAGSTGAAAAGASNAGAAAATASSPTAAGVAGGAPVAGAHAAATSTAGAAAPASQSAAANGRMRSSPLARAIARESGIDLARVTGSGPGGRVVKRDVQAAAGRGGRAGAAGVSAASAAVGSAAGASGGSGGASSTLRAESIPVSGKRKVIAERLSQSKFSAPHYYLKLAVAADALVNARAKLNAKRDKKVSLNAFLMKFAAEAIKRHPMINASWQGATIQLFGTVDIGLAVAAKDGLITPVVRDCGSKGVVQIDEELSALIDKALSGKLAPPDYTGATFTISNLGSFGIEEFTAIINPPGSAILAVGSIKKEPVVGANDQIEVKTLMRLTLSCDHRVIDGATGANFLKHLSDIIEDPIRILY